MRVIELRAPVPLASLVVQSVRHRGAKTERYRLSKDDLRAGDVPQEDSACVVPIGTRAVALAEPVPIEGFREVPNNGRGKGRDKGSERVRIVAR